VAFKAAESFFAQGETIMSNMTGKFLSQWQMAEAKRTEDCMNAIQKRNGTNYPLSEILAWGCGCCIGPVIMEGKKIPSPAEADEILRQRKHERKRKQTCEQANSHQKF
jgi:hypothetical protein